MARDCLDCTLCLTIAGRFTHHGFFGDSNDHRFLSLRFLFALWEFENPFDTCKTAGASKELSDRWLAIAPVGKVGEAAVLDPLCKLPHHSRVKALGVTDSGEDHLPRANMDDQIGHNLLGRFYGKKTIVCNEQRNFATFGRKLMLAIGLAPSRTVHTARLIWDVGDAMASELFCCHVFW